MKQILHIFRKDTRHFWLEIVLSVVVAAALVWLTPKEWVVGGGASERMRISQYAGVLAALLTVSWWLLIVRAVQAETLVGDHQFWITRPYDWRKLLASKVLFAAVWIGVPCLAMQLALLHAGGFSAMHYAGGLTANLMLQAAFLLLPMFALATVTSNFARLVMTALGGLIALVGFMFVTYDTPHSRSVPSIPYPNVLLVPLLLVGCAVAVGLQYATRRTWVARALLLAVPLLMAASVYGYQRQSLVDRAYPQAGGAAPVSLRLEKQPTSARSFAGADYVDASLKYAGVADGTAVFNEDFKYTLTAADGTQWTSPWQATLHRFVPGQAEQRTDFNLMMKPEVYDKFKQGPVTLQLTLALSRYRVDAVMDSTYPTVEAAIPGIGYCAPEGGRRQGLDCRAPLDGPQLTRVTVNWSWIPCDLPQVPSDAATHGDMWFTPDGQSFFLTSVWHSQLWFGGDEGDSVNGTKLHVCPGSPLTVTHYQRVDRTQMVVTLPNVVLPARVDPT